MPKLKPEVKSRWTTALRSGEYPQARGALHRVKSTECDLGYCCLGVLATVEGVPTEESPDQDGRAIFVFTPNWTSAGSPPDHWFRSLSDIDSFEEADSIRRKLIRMNDTERLSFPEIADWIERNL